MTEAVIYTDNFLLTQLKHGMEDAFIAIYKKYWQQLYGIAYNRINSKQAAEDVVQEVMTSLWYRREELEIQNLESWLSAATKYSVFRQMVRYGNKTILPLSGESAFSDIPDFDYRLLNQFIQKEINLLPEKCRLVFEYSRNFGLSNRQIASNLEISEKSVEKHITKAISKLRIRLKDAVFLFTILFFA